MKPLLNLSLDLDNKWSYLKTANKPTWQEYPSYLPTACQHILQVLSQTNTFATIFVVGRDLLDAASMTAVRSLVQAGHDLGNHSFHHEPWLHLYDRDQIAYELDKTDELLARVGGKHSRGFRGPGYSDSPLVHELLSERGYRYCASQLSSCLGPIARTYYFLKTGLKRSQRQERDKLFGSFSDVLGKNRPYRLSVGSPNMWMMPVTVMPILRTPFHFSYLHYAAEKNTWLARFYLRMSLRLCRWSGIEPSMLLHPLDFLGGDEEPELAFFPGMKHSGAVKRQRLQTYLQEMAKHFTIQTQGEAAARLDDRRYSRRSLPTESQVAAGYASSCSNPEVVG
jgi:peptidoglycan/xylan/chitin deacetylase (PgdA/CDA1 family)